MEKYTRPTTRSRRVLFAGVFLCSLATRVVAIDRPLNTDEALWVGRGAAFVEAVLRGDLARTYQRPHPGITTMWLVGLSNAARCAVLERSGAPSPSWRECLHGLATSDRPPLGAYVAARGTQAVLTAAASAVFVLLATLLFGPRVALPAAALLTFEPFFVAYQRYITTDALQVDLTAIGVLFFLLHLREGGWRWLAGASVALALGTATKVPTILVAPALIAWVVAAEAHRWPAWPARGWRRRGLELAVGLSLAAAVVLVVCPALWVRPIGTAQRFLADLRFETRPNAARLDDPSATFYLQVLAWRLSPFLQAGALIALVALARPSWRRRMPWRGEMQALLLLVVSVLLLLRLAGGAASDRYVLPVVPLLALIAGAGWAQAGGLFEDRRRGRWAMALVPCLLGGGQLALLAAHFPAALTFYNPLLGGGPAASRVLAMGQGEGLDEAARWITAQPGGARLRVASVMAPAFAPYFEGTTVDLEAATTREGVDADRVILHIRAVRAGWPDPFVASYLWAQRPLHAITAHGVDYVRIYRGPIALPPTLDTLATSAASSGP